MKINFYIPVLFLIGFFLFFPPALTIARDVATLEEMISEKDREYQKQLTLYNSGKNQVTRLEGELREREIGLEARKKEKDTALKKLRNIQKLVEDHPEISTEKERKNYAQALKNHESAERNWNRTNQELAAARRQRNTAESSLQGITTEKNNLKRELSETRFNQLRETIERERIITASAESGCGPNDTISQCQDLALENAKRAAADRGSANLIDSVVEIGKNFQITRDEFRTRVKAIILGYRVLDENWVSKTSYYYKISARVKGQIPPEFQQQLAGEVTPTSSPTPTPTLLSSNEWTDPITGIEFILVKGGCFQMGDTFNEGADDEKPVHKVCIDDFYLAKHEVTKKVFTQFISETNYKTDAEKSGNCWIWNGNEWESKKGAYWRNPNFPQNEQHPVTCISWNDTKKFLKWLIPKSAFTFRLPSEAEWEYACREGGKKVRFGNGKDTADPAEINFNGKDKYKKSYSFTGVYRGKTTPVGSFSPNALGLYDMSGNIYEWVEDIYSSDIYRKLDKDNPIYIGSGSYRVLRGGSWGPFPQYLRCAYRNYTSPADRYSNLGFRLLRTR